MSYEDQEAVLAVLAVERGLLDPAATVDIIRAARRTKVAPLELALERNLASEAVFIRALADELGYEFVDLFDASGEYRTSVELLERAQVAWLERFVAIPMRDRQDHVVVATADPSDPDLTDYLELTFPEGYRCVLALPGQVRQLLLTEASAAVAATFDGGDLANPAAPSPIQEIVSAAPTARTPVLEWVEVTVTSDLHFEIAEDGRMLCRFRIDNDLIVQHMPLRGRELEVIAAIMTRAGMDSANTKEPQDGSFPFVAGGRRIDVRAAMLPALNGPKLVLRLLDPANLRSLEELGFGPEALGLMRRASQLTQGLVVVAGPTGSGKTTTLYAMLREVANVTKNVMTVENPIEYRIPLISQIPVRDDLGDRSVTFARALRTILRLDPDVILVGEVRDAETARVALDAALTGHLVLTTIHAPSAFGVFSRFIEMGIPPYLVAEALTLAVSQRLTRRLHTCREVAPPSPELARALSEAKLPVPREVATPKGCASCHQRGYRGRIAVAELVAPDQALRNAIARRDSIDQLHSIAASSKGYVPLATDLIRLLHGHHTSPAEVLRATTTGALG